MLTLAVRRRQHGELDAHGNPVITYADAQPWPVYGYAPGTNTESVDPSQNRDLSVIVWTIYAPAGPATPTEYDLVDLDDGITYAVQGRPLDYTHGPWQHPTAGVVVTLRRTEG